MYSFRLNRGMQNIVDAKVAIYMNAHSKDKTFNESIVTVIRNSIVEERKNRILNRLDVNAHSKKGKEITNHRAALIANKKLSKVNLTATDISLYKKCKILEYENGTGKCVWGIPRVRKNLGYDPISGYEL